MLTFALALGVLCGLLRGGTPTTLSAKPWRLIWLAPVAFGLQLLMVYGLDSNGPREVGALLHLTSYVALGVLLWLNRGAAGAEIIGLGLALNFLVIAANGGYMPVSPEALLAKGQSELAALPAGTILAGSKDILPGRADTRLWILSDIITVPWLPLWQRAFSIGDVVLAAGLFVLVQAAMLPEDRARKSP